MSKVRPKGAKFKMGFQLARKAKHETWIKKTENENSRIVRISHQKGKDIPKPLFKEMLRQAGIKDEDEFQKILRS